MADRKRELILTGGFNVYPSQVEAAIRSMQSVADVAVVGLPDGAKGELVCAVVVLDERTAPDSVTLEAVREHAERTVPRYALPHRLEVIEEMPRSQIGKILRRVVREELLAAREAASTASEAVTSGIVERLGEGGRERRGGPGDGEGRSRTHR